MNNWIVVGFYTKNTPYEQEIEKLKQSLDDLEITYYVRGITSKGSWRENIHSKIIFLKGCLNIFNSDIVYIDSDCIVRKYPELFDEIPPEYHIGVGLIKEDRGFLNKVSSSTIYLKNCEETKKLLDLWEKEDEDFDKYPFDDISLGAILNGFKVFLLPETYCQIFDLMKDAGEPVIEAYQASRRLKEAINAGRI